MRIGLLGDSLTKGRPGVSFFNILEKWYPHISFENLGKPGETVISLHTRISKENLDTNYDLIFLWIGVNDIYSKLLKVQAQPVAKDAEEFTEYYKKVLEMVIASTKQVVIVSPAIVGEVLVNESNKELKNLSSIIQSLSNKYLNVSYLDMHSVFEEYLANVTSSNYISTKVLRVMVDVLFYKNPASIDKLSKKRGLHLTLDGIHLNSTGAKLAAYQYASMIDLSIQP